MSTAADGTGTTESGARPTDTAQSDATQSDAAPATLAQDAPAPLTSLTSLLGGSFEGGAACAADGSCD